VFPTPGGVWESFVDGFKDGSFGIGVIVSLKRIILGYVISLVIGVSLGFLIARFRLIEETIGTLVVALQALPSVCWLPVAILWFGLSEKSILFVVIAGALLSITIATESGIKNLPPIYMRAAKTLGSKGFDLYTRVIFPAALPSIVTGMKMGWAFAWRSLMAAELIYVSLGLGQLLQMGRELNDINRVFAVIFLIILIGVVADRLLFSPLERAVQERWGFKLAATKSALK
jgi:NitT/TauT family transport system permease protein